MAKPLPHVRKLRFRGKVQSDEFGRGALAVGLVLNRFELDSLGSAQRNNADIPSSTDRLCAALENLLDTRPQERLGAIAALSDYLVRTIDVGGCLEGPGVPFEEEPKHAFGDRDSWLLPRGSRLFDVKGTPVSVSPSLVAYRWDAPSGPALFSVEVVRMLGREVTREHFRAMCGGVLAEGAR